MHFVPKIQVQTIHHNEIFLNASACLCVYYTVDKHIFYPRISTQEIGERHSERVLYITACEMREKLPESEGSELDAWKMICMNLHNFISFPMPHVSPYPTHFYCFNHNAEPGLPTLKLRFSSNLQIRWKTTVQIFHLMALNTKLIQIIIQNLINDYLLYVHINIRFSNKKVTNVLLSLSKNQTHCYHLIKV